MNEEKQAGAQPAPTGLRAQIDLPAPVAVWVFAAHAIALLSPLALLWAVYANWDYVAVQARAPGFFYVAVAFMMASGAFEFAQNTADRWYLLPGMGSTTRPALADFLFLHVQRAQHDGADHRLHRRHLVAPGALCAGGRSLRVSLPDRAPALRCVRRAGLPLHACAFPHPGQSHRVPAAGHRAAHPVLLRAAAQDARPVAARLRGAGQHLGAVGDCLGHPQQRERNPARLGAAESCWRWPRADWRSP